MLYIERMQKVRTRSNYLTGERSTRSRTARTWKLFRKEAI